MPLFGTHNSCTYGSLQPCFFNIMLPWTRNQSLTLQEQLDHGIRWFDIRLSYSKKDNNIYASHTALTNHSFKYIMDIVTNFLEHSMTQMLFMNVRIDYHDRSNSSVINTNVADLLGSYISYIGSRNDCGATIEQTTTLKKVLLYCSDGTIQHSLVYKMELMPTVSFWDADSIDVCEQRLMSLEDEFKKLESNIYVFPSNRMIVFDYASNNVLWYTDKQIFGLITKYREIIMDSHPTILAGNHTQEWMSLF